MTPERVNADLTAACVAAARVPGTRWSVCVRDRAGAVLAAVDADRVLSTASVPKLLLLAEVARRIETGEVDPDAPLDRRPDLAVADSGLWQHLRCDRLPLADVAVLVAAVSDNWATNVLLDHVGPDAVGAVAAALGLTRTALHDRVRDARTPDLPTRLSSGTAAELSALMASIERGDCLGPAVSARLRAWTSLNTDLSMVAAASGADPLAHPGPDGVTAVAAASDLVLRNKTGTDDGVRADVGTVGRPGATVSYAVIANWDPRAAGGDRTRAVLAAMQGIGEALAGTAGADPGNDRDSRATAF